MIADYEVSHNDDKTEYHLSLLLDDGSEVLFMSAKQNDNNEFELTLHENLSQSIDDVKVQIAAIGWLLRSIEHRNYLA